MGLYRTALYKTAKKVPMFSANSDNDKDAIKRVESIVADAIPYLPKTTYYRGQGDRKLLNSAALLYMAGIANETWPKHMSNFGFAFDSKGHPWGISNFNKGGESELYWDIQKKEKRPSYILRLADEEYGPGLFKGRDAMSKKYRELMKG